MLVATPMETSRDRTRLHWTANVSRTEYRQSLACKSLLERELLSEGPGSSGTKRPREHGI